MAHALTPGPQLRMNFGNKSVGPSGMTHPSLVGGSLGLLTSSQWGEGEGEGPSDCMLRTWVQTQNGPQRAEEGLLSPLPASVPV